VGERVSAERESFERARFFVVTNYECFISTVRGGAAAAPACATTV